MITNMEDYVYRFNGCMDRFLLLKILQSGSGQIRNYPQIDENLYKFDSRGQIEHLKRLVGRKRLEGRLITKLQFMRQIVSITRIQKAMAIWHWKHANSMATNAPHTETLRTHVDTCVVRTWGQSGDSVRNLAHSILTRKVSSVDLVDR